MLKICHPQYQLLGNLMPTVLWTFTEAYTECPMCEGELLKYNASNIALENIMFWKLKIIYVKKCKSKEYPIRNVIV